MDLYLKVLDFDEANAFASLGVANVLAEHGKLEEAQEIFRVLRETNPNMWQPRINLAHLMVAKENYETAITNYEKTLLDFFPEGKNFEIELFIAKAHYKQGNFS